MKKATAIAPSNIAFIKYWGKKDEALRLPKNGSISMNLSNLITTTTVEFSDRYKSDQIVVIQNDQFIKNQHVHEFNELEKERIIEHIDRIRKIAKNNDRVKVVTKNNFPTGTGLSSSASGFAALTVAASNAAGLQLSEKELSVLARQGSGSACRSIPDGFVEWLDGDTSETSYAVSLHPPSWWDIVDVVALVSREPKDVSSTEGQKLVGTSPFFPVRLSRIKERIARCKEYLAAKNFSALGELIEGEALELHAVMLTSQPSLIYWIPRTLKMMKLVKKWRAEGLEAYFTINTGQDVHIICEASTTNRVTKLLSEVEEVQEVIVNHPAPGTRLTDQRLF